MEAHTSESGSPATIMLIHVAVGSQLVAFH